ncbi:MAG: epoxyqueuosine reductase [Ruminococcaceae bacterium]|nr:epoxyqueuosine reductase [Oscillospiraceae bacterium]
MNFDIFCEKLTDSGLCKVGFSFIGDLLPERLRAYPYAVTLMFRMSDAVLDDMDDSPTYAYFHHYRTANALLDSCAVRAGEMLRREGARYFPIAASQSVHDQPDEYTGIFQHKTAAVRAGLGWIGRSGLFVSTEHGPRVRLATVLTDMELPLPEKLAENGCANCRKCAHACPAGAITGELYVPGAERSTVVDAEKCSKFMKARYMHIGRGSVCGRCMVVCPYGKRNSI